MRGGGRGGFKEGRGQEGKDNKEMKKIDGEERV